MNRRWIIALIVLILILTAAAIWKNKNKPKGEKVKVEKVTRCTLQETVAASGRIFPETEVAISSDVSGEVVELYVQEGDSVQAGQLLARVDPDAFQSAVERGRASVNNAKAQAANAKSGVEASNANVIQVESQVESAEAQLTNAEAIHQRNENLLKEGVISEQDFDASLSNVETLRANLRSAKASLRAAKANLESTRQAAKAAGFTVSSTEASLRELQTNLRRTSIYSPVTGVVSRLSIEKGERVVGTIQMTGTELMRIADMSRMEVQVDVNENDVLRVSVGDSVDVEVDAYLDKHFSGIVTQIANSASNVSTSVGLANGSVTNFVVKILLDPASYKEVVSANIRYPFRPGMSASVDIFTETRRNVVCVPIQAVAARQVDEDNKGDNENTSSENSDIMEVVFALNGDTVGRIPVKTGIQDDERIEIISGLEVDQEVVTGPYNAVSRKLKGGSKVQRQND